MKDAAGPIAVLDEMAEIPARPVMPGPDTG
jgi:hypothetical protein